MQMYSWLGKAFGVSRYPPYMVLRVLVEEMAIDDDNLCCREPASIGAEG